MKRIVTAILTVAFAAGLAGAAAAGPWFAKGDMYCAPGCWNYDSGNELFDDGLHGDGAAGDGKFGGSVATDQPGGRREFKIALADWSQSHFPWCNLWVHTAGPGDVVHFTLDTNTYADGWWPQSNIVWTDHYAPPGTTFEVIGGAPETGSWGSGVPAALIGTVWTRLVTIGTPGSYEAKFRATGTWDILNLGTEGAGAPCGANLQYTTSLPNQDVLFEFNTTNGRTRVTVVDPTHAARRTWGQVKSIYR